MDYAGTVVNLTCCHVLDTELQTLIMMMLMSFCN